MAYPRNGPASRAVALDLMLRTFMNSADFHPSNPKIWENIAKLVPGTTPQQCAQRWYELRTSSQSIAGDYSGLTATGRPISGQGRRQMTRYVRSMFSQQMSTGASPSHNSRGSFSSSSHGNVMRSQSGYHYGRQTSGGPTSVSLGNMERVGQGGGNMSVEAILPQTNNEGNGNFVANFCQTHLSGGEGKGEPGKGDGDSDKSANTEQRRSSDGAAAKTSEDAGSNTDLNGSCTSVGQHGPSMVIHVCDEAKKLKRDFVCPRDILVREMHYFEEYLSSDTQLWDEVDISVHCDVPVFEWLMKYTKRGMFEGPCGEKLSSPLEPPKLEPNTAISILISSDFLKMDTLVEECLNFCHDKVSQIIASPCNMGCISERLLARLAAKFSPLELEGIIDKKDKIKSKLFLYQLEQLFDVDYSIPECPANAATLYRCKYCEKLLTAEQQDVLPCAPKRLSVDCHGRVIFNHERAESWNINHYLQTLQKQESLSPRDLYWRVWGHVNWLQCDSCHCMFQCCELPLCAHHPQPVMVKPTYSGEHLTNPTHSCCDRPVLGFSTLPQVQDGCAFRDHVITSNSAHHSSPSPGSSTLQNSREVCSILCQLKTTICAEALRVLASKEDSTMDRETEHASVLQQAQNEVCFLLSEEREPRLPPTTAGEVPIAQNSHSRDISRGRSNNSLQHSSSSQAVGTVAPARHQHRTGGGLARQMSRDSQQQSHDLVELEEDDECEHPPVMVHQPRPRRGRHHHHGQHGPQIRTKHSRADLQVEWIWDGQKSKRWNQDMQRESDERRLAHLVAKLNSTTEVSGSAAASSRSMVGAGKTSRGEVAFAGGIFSRLEAQFRAQQAAKAIALQNTQTRSQGTSRKR